MTKTAVLTLTFALFVSGCSFFNSRDPEYKAAEAKKAEAEKTEEQKAEEEKAKKEKAEEEKKEKEKAGSESSFVYDLNDTENAELNKYYDNRKKAKAKKQKEIFGY